MDFHDLCLLGGVLFMGAGFTMLYAGTAALEEWRGREENRELVDKSIFGARDEHWDARLKISELRRQRWIDSPRVRLTVYMGGLLMLCSAVCFWLR